MTEIITDPKEVKYMDKAAIAHNCEREGVHFFKQTLENVSLDTWQETLDEVHGTVAIKCAACCIWLRGKFVVNS